MAPAQQEIAQRPANEIDLPAPRDAGVCSLEEALWLRRSVREFRDVPLGLEEVGQLLWAAQGLTDPPDRRTAPSAGATYPLTVYVATPDGAFRYVPQGHLLQQVAGEDLRPQLCRASYEQASLRHAALVVVLAADYGRTTRRYGADRGVRYVHIEAGHAAQNLLLQAAVDGFGAVPMGAFEDSLVKKTLALAEDEFPVYLMAVGVPGLT